MQKDFGGHFLFSKNQIEAIRHDRGPALVVAGPGSGKTCVITNRARFLTEELGILPQKILTVTFAKAAAREMRGRFLRLCNKNSEYSSNHDSVIFSTIHSLCYKILKRSNLYSRLEPVPDKFKFQILCSIIRSMPDGLNSGYSDNYLYKMASLDISYFKNYKSDENKINLHIPEDTFKYIFESYEAKLKKYGFYDFDDMTEMALSVADKDSESFISEFDYVMADEFQDTSMSQFKLLQKIAASGNIMVVGDDDQTIYGFRGANPDIMQLFIDYYSNENNSKGVRLYKLFENYRSSPDIVKASGMVISENRDRIYKRLEAAKYSFADTKKISKKCKILEFDTYGCEAEAIVRLIKNESSYRDRSFAVLARTNTEAEVVGAVLIREGIQVKLPKGIPDIFEYPAIKIIMSYLKAACGKANKAEIVNILRVPESIFPSMAVRSVKTFKSDIFLYAGSDIYFQNEAEKIIGRINIISTLDPESAVDFVRRACGVDEFFKVQGKLEEYEERVEKLMQICKGFTGISGFVSFAEKYHERLSVENENEEKKNISVMTIHTSKGLEFDDVWIVGVNQGIIPYAGAITKHEIAEERRLLYVAMTRARDRLFISYHLNFGKRKEVPSEFIGNLIKEYKLSDGI